MNNSQKQVRITDTNHAAISEIHKASPLHPSISSIANTAMELGMEAARKLLVPGSEPAAPVEAPPPEAPKITVINDPPMLTPKRKVVWDTGRVVKSQHAPPEQERKEEHAQDQRSNPPGQAVPPAGD